VKDPEQEDSAMKFITQWKLRPGKLPEAVDRFLTTGDPKPEGVRSLGRWFSVDMEKGFHLIEADDAAVVAKYAARWADLLELETCAVIEDAQAVDAMREVAGITAKVGGAATGQR
jgi:hypothetical protein